jgi:3,4-dihydroxy-2-butanone 4-phosphate synthase
VDQLRQDFGLPVLVGTTTGISAADRASTVLAAIRVQSTTYGTRYLVAEHQEVGPFISLYI